MSELQGCDIHKTKAENAKAGFTNPSTPAAGEKAGEQAPDTKEGATPPVTK
jgi:hypothetical protein